MAGVISSISSNHEVEYCVDMYLALNDDTFMVADRSESLKNLFMKTRLKKFVRVYKENDQILAWIYGDLIKLEHCNYSNFQQIYYCSDQSGFKAYRCLVLLHDALYAHSKSTQALYCVSSGSHMDPANVLARSLERNGWIRRGHIVARRIEREGLQVAPRGSQTGPG